MFESETVELFGRRRVQVYRAGHGPTIVWLHGPHGVRKNDPVIAELAKRHTVVAPVAPGFNNVDELDDVRDVHDLALHYDDLFEALALDGISLIGHSFGGMIAAEVAAHVPKRGFHRSDCGATTIRSPTCSRARTPASTVSCGRPANRPPPLPIRQTSRMIPSRRRSPSVKP
jgi:pimeloyl-ACP methyl ester carboxylesterase